MSDQEEEVKYNKQDEESKQTDQNEDEEEGVDENVYN